VAKRVRTRRGLRAANVSVSSVAVDYVRSLHHFHDKTVLSSARARWVKLTLRHLPGIKPLGHPVTNRSTGKKPGSGSGLRAVRFPGNNWTETPLVQADMS